MTTKQRQQPKAMDLLRDFPVWLFNDIPERPPKYAYRSLLVIFPIAVVSIAFFVWSLIALPIPIALLAGTLSMAVGFIVVLRLVDRIVPKRFPKNEDS
jgi:hypothetical protein